ncbi:ATP-binding protein [Saccharolobus solfataricus]|uniref:ATP-binding protein n=3 Tax=Saccharolobus solfataricus TaxID=2287 RepID=A0A0E3MHJ6_SACSO|nr:helicase HerA-like domain-containing protein [Saccharolobus solfataricus]AKA73849.1 ATP-binding protein [Saccharolobus solfataricus]AKA76547.1 ATP-binding protein [Saccharolobus solfataricus]AKA79240.1 ATP-binding protein [Saccharolobus solfataricus]AZF68329.1 ATP-binding protein [Saccharolobus solfataricus]AZF70949.1 ATP-binding protein [Saccharolobus solfataricus]
MMELYKVRLKSGVDYQKLKATELFGNVFELIFIKKSRNEMDFYVRTAAKEEILRQYFVLLKADEYPTNRFVAVLKLKKESDFYANLEYSNLLNLISSLEEGEQIRIWVVLEPRLNDLFIKKADKLKLQAQKAMIGKRKKELLANILESYAKDNLYLLDIKIFSNQKSRLKLLFDYAKQLIHTKSRKLRMEVKKAKKFKEKQPKIGAWEAIAKYKVRLWIDEDKLNENLPLPSPTQVPIPMSIGVSLPYFRLERKDIYLGDDILYAEKVFLDWTDFQRHAIIYGSTGSGKSNTLEILAQELAKYGIVIFLDPNSQSARKLSQIANYYFTITKDRPNYGINILQLPHIFQDREKDIDYQISKVLQLFDKLLNLVDTAVNVRYILQVLLRQMYRVSDRITFRDVYDAVIALQQGTLDLDVNDETFEHEKELLQQMQAQSFMSILSRLKLLVDNNIFKIVTSETTIDWDRVINETKRGLIIFDVGKSAGNEVSEMMQMIITLSLFNYVFLRDALGKEKIPIFLVIDEAQNVAHFDFINEVLAEARKYGLHLVLATQSFVRLQALAGENNARAINANTNVKLLMRLTEGSDISQLAKSVGANQEIVEALPKLSIGQAFLFLLGKTGEFTVPKLVQIRPSELQDKEKEPTKGFEPKGVSKGLTKETINPALALLKEPPDVLGQLILYTAFEKGEYGITITDLIAQLGIKREVALAKLAELEKLGAVQIEQRGRSKIVKYAKGLFRLRGIVENEEGKKVALRVLRKYLKDGYIVVPGRQEGDIRPDFIALTYDKTTLRPNYSNIVIIEIESPNEVAVHAEQVRKNMQKYLSLDERTKSIIKEIHIWTSEEKFDKLKEIYDNFINDNSIPQEYKTKVKIFPVEIKQKVKQGALKEKKTKAETGEFNGKREEKAESIARQAAQGAPNNANSKLGSLLKIGHLEFQVLDEVNDKVIVKTGDKDYKISKKDLIDLEGLKDLIVEAKIENGYLKVKTSLGLIQKISLEPL